MGSMPCCRMISRVIFVWFNSLYMVCMMAKMNKKLVSGLLSFVTLFGGMGLTGCSDEDGGWPYSVSEETYYANRFGKDVMNMYYLWNAEIADDLAGWAAETNTDPIGTVDRIRYHDSNGYIDKWTMMTDDMSSFVSSVGGVSTTFGWSLTVYLVNQETKQCAAVVNFVHDDTPAARAGLKRGDILLSIDGQPLTTDNYLNLYYNTSLSTSLGRYNAADNTIYDVGKTVELTAVNMYEDPVLCDSVYEFNGKKVGYLAYSAFDLTSISKLIAVCKDFKAAGVRELVLDLRYNGGGYVLTENVLASMLAPQQAVASGQVFEREVYNNYLTEYLQKQGASMETCFATDYTYQDGDTEKNVSTQDANIGLEKIYALIGTGSASASEALLGGLMPYMDVRLIGEQSSGKYCTGMMLAAEDAYNEVPEAIRNWGLYVMISIYQNAAGETPCMPDGLRPDVGVDDEPMLAYVLGDVNEPLLRQALTEAGRTYDDAPSAVQTRSLTSRYVQLPGVQKPVFGKRIQQPVSVGPAVR